MSFESLKDVISRVIAQRDNGQARSFSAAEACALATKLIGAELPHIASRTKVSTLEHGILTVFATGSVVASELQLGSSVVLAELQKRFPQISKIQVRTNYAAFQEQST